MKNIIVFVAAFCLAMVGFSEKVLAGPTPLSIQESAQLTNLASNDGLLALKAGGSFPNAPRAMDMREESALRELSGKSGNLEQLKAGDGGDIGLVSLLVIVILVVVLLRVI
jgi:hypothetical protein